MSVLLQPLATPFWHHRKAAGLEVTDSGSSVSQAEMDFDILCCSVEMQKRSLLPCRRERT